MPGKRVNSKGLWGLVEGVDLCRRLERRLTPAGFAVALTGSVLTKGKSYKGLDLIVYPLNTQQVDLPALYEALRQVGLVFCIPVEQVQAHWRKRGSTDTKHVEIWCLGKRRIDLFILK